MTNQEIHSNIKGMEYLYSLINQFKGGINEVGEPVVVRNLNINLSEEQIAKANDIIFRVITGIVTCEPEEEEQEQVITPLFPEKE